uniref:Uncharacterized protein n=1 Tax=Dromaius novaehollandiae TaxID=8790 RepID=A0A8C4PD22_DRONO
GRDHEDERQRDDDPRHFLQALVSPSTCRGRGGPCAAGTPAPHAASGRTDPAALAQLQRGTAGFRHRLRALQASEGCRGTLVRSCGRDAPASPAWRGDLRARAPGGNGQPRNE